MAKNIKARARPDPAASEERAVAETTGRHLMSTIIAAAKLRALELQLALADEQEDKCANCGGSILDGNCSPLYEDFCADCAEKMEGVI